LHTLRRRSAFFEEPIFIRKHDFPAPFVFSLPRPLLPCPIRCSSRRSLVFILAFFYVIAGIGLIVIPSFRVLYPLMLMLSPLLFPFFLSCFPSACWFFQAHFLLSSSVMINGCVVLLQKRIGNILFPLPPLVCSASPLMTKALKCLKIKPLTPLPLGPSACWMDSAHHLPFRLILAQRIFPSLFLLCGEKRLPM